MLTNIVGKGYVKGYQEKRETTKKYIKSNFNVSFFVCLREEKVFLIVYNPFFVKAYHSGLDNLMATS